MYLNLYKSMNVLQVIEQQFQEGTLCAAAVRQQLMWIISSLYSQADQSEFLEQFRHIPVPGIIRALYSCRHYDIHNIPSIPCCPLRAPPEWGGRTVAEARAAAVADAECCALHPESRKALEQAQAEGLVPANHQIAVALIPPGEGIDLSPSEPAEDDIDGVARMRFTMLFPPSTLKQHKRKLSREATAAEKLAIDLDATVEKLSRMEMDVREHMNRSLQINKAAERLTGYTQAELRLLILDCSPSNPWTQIRADHARAAARITMRWRLANQAEGHMYTVRVHKSGTHSYHLIHIRFHLVQGLLIGCEQSILPLPDDPARPPPPYVEGVDLDEETLLYGYRPPQPTQEALS